MKAKIFKKCLKFDVAEIMVVIHAIYLPESPSKYFPGKISEYARSFLETWKNG